MVEDSCNRAHIVGGGWLIGGGLNNKALICGGLISNYYGTLTVSRQDTRALIGSGLNI